MADEPEVIPRTLKEKLLFYTTAFFILLGTFSLFAFLFLVPFVIEPAFTTIFMQFDTVPALCMTSDVTSLRGAKNCTWTSCKEGCTKDVFECTQIRVNYKVGKFNNETNVTEYIGREFKSNKNGDVVSGVDGVITLDGGASPVGGASAGVGVGGVVAPGTSSFKEHSIRFERALREYDYADGSALVDVESGRPLDDLDSDLVEYPDGLYSTNISEWYFINARLLPNVKGCGYPPMLNCTIWSKKYKTLGTNFSCYYSKIDPGIVISDLDMWQNTLNLVYAMAIPIPSFIISVIYLTFAYFYIYNEDEESAPLDQNAESIAGEENDVEENGCVENGIPNGGTPLPISSVPITPNSDLASFGHQLKVKMADDMSRDSIDAGLISNSGSFQGNLSKTMTTSISTPPGPIAAV